MEAHPQLLTLDTVKMMTWHVWNQTVNFTQKKGMSLRAKERGLKSLGTLGSGNHFLELQTVGSVVDHETATTGDCTKINWSR